MRSLFFAFFFILTTVVASAQSDSLDNEIDTSGIMSKTLKKGFYLTHEDFLNNTPSFTKEFTTIKKAAAKDRFGHEIFRVKYDLADGEGKIKETLWGFADDSLFYVRIFASLLHTDYWKLECNAGKYPFAYVKIDQAGGYMGTGFLFNKVLPLYEIYVIDKNGKAKQATANYLKKLFAEAPEILEAYKKESKKGTNKVKSEYLLKFNTYLSTH
ncbi:MAG: hypothetical protein V4556_08195 [Bacteroidota bacterium]